MGQTKVEIFILLLGIIVLVFIIGTILFGFEFRRRQIIYRNEKHAIEEQHQLDLLNTQLRSQRQTMQHIGQEIHDSVAQKLTLASIYTQRMQFESKQAGDTESLSSISKIINDALLELRQLSQDLTNDAILNATLDELIKEECDKVNTTGACSAMLAAGSLPPLDISVKNSLLRIAQEFIQNSLKHAACKNIAISVDMEGDSIKMKLEDDGKGFNTAVAGHNGIGLDNIRRRVQQLGGIHSLHSEAEKGTRLEITIPLQTDKK